MENKKDIKYPEMDYFMNESLSDVVFVIEGQRLPASKHLLIVKSQVFRAMFSGNFKESKDKEIIIKDTTYKAFKTLIRFIYCEQLVLTSDEDFKFIREICKLSDRYQVLRIMERVSKYLKKMLRHNNVEVVTTLKYKFGQNLSFDLTDLKTFEINGIKFGEIIKIGSEYKMNDLMETINKFIEQNFSQFVHKDMSVLLKINELTNNFLFELITKNFLKTEGFFKKYTTGGYVRYPKDHTPLEFNFDKMDQN